MTYTIALISSTYSFIFHQASTEAKKPLWKLGEIIVRRHLISLPFLILFFLFDSSQAKAANPAFALSFKFAPPFTLATALAPVFYLDVCGNANCTVVLKSIAMNCSLQRTGLLTGGTVVGCMVQAIALPSYPDPNMLFLNHPINLRIRESNLVSPPFPFVGGQAALPEVFYNFTVTPGPTGFSILAG